MTKGFRMSFPQKTDNGAVKRMFCVFVDFWGKERVASVGQTKYPMIVRDDFSPYTWWMNFIYRMSDAAEV